MPVYALAAGVLLGGALQLALQLPFLKKYGVFPKPSLSLRDPAIGRIFALMGPAALGVGVYQLNIIVTMRYASMLAEGSVSYLYYATRLMELPLGVFGVAVSTAVLPSLSEFVVKKDWISFKDSLSFAMRAVNFVIIPSMVGLIVLGLPIVDLLFRRGEFGEAAASGTAYALYFYALGLIPVALSRVLLSVFYSLKDTKTPVAVAFISFVVNIIMCYILMGPLGHGGLALATSISATVNLIGLLIVLNRKVGFSGDMSVITSAIKSLIASAFMALIVVAIISYFDWRSASLAVRLVTVITCVLVGIISYLFVAKILKSPEIGLVKEILLKVRRRAA